MKFLFKLVLFLVILTVIAFGALHFVLNNEKKTDVLWTEKDYTTGLEKAKVKIDSIETLSLDNLSLKRYVAKGKVEVDAEFSNAEVSAGLTKANEKDGPIRSVLIKFNRDGTVETSFKVSRNAMKLINKSGIKMSMSIPILICDVAVDSVKGSRTSFLINYLIQQVGGKPIYAKGKLEKASDKSINLKIDFLQIGGLALPESALPAIEKGVVNFVNNLIQSTEGFIIEEFKVEEGKIYYRGTLPEEVKGIEGED